MLAPNNPIRSMFAQSHVASGSKNAGSLRTVALFILLIGFLAIAFYSPSSASSVSGSSSFAGVRIGIGGATQGPAVSGDLGIPTISGSSAAALRMLMALQGGSETIQMGTPAEPRPTGCINADAWCLGEEVSATVFNAPLRAGFRERRIQWGAPDGTTAQTVDIVTDPQTDTFTLPLTGPFAQVGKWTVRTISNRGGGVAVATFQVEAPNQPSVDLELSMTGPAEATADVNATYTVTVTNLGPDAAVNVSLSNPVPYNTTFVSASAPEGFLCTTPNQGDPGDIECSGASLLPNTSAIFNFTFNANSDVQNGLPIINIAKTDSSTNEPNTSNNSASFTSTSAPPSGGGEDCTLTCPGNITAIANTTENGQRGAHVTYDAPIPSGNCGVVSSNPASGSFFPVGTTTVTASSSQNGASCSFTVTVTDDATAPTITCPADKTATADSNCQAVVDPGQPTTTGDNVTVTSSRSDERPLSDPFTVGTTTIIWTATNGAGSASCQQTVTVTDTTAPTITCPANISQATDPGACSASVDPGTAEATDNCNATVTGTRSDNQPLDAPYPTGTTTITWTATDDAGNSASCTQTVTVTDSESPTLSCPGPTSASADANCQAPVPDVTSGATASDNCPVTLTQSPAAGTLVGPGTHTITVTATDGSNNTSTCTTTFTVTDTTAPTISCPANITTSTDPDACSANVDPGTASATDNCDSNPSVSGVRSDGQALNAPYPKGTTTITWTASDDAGNSASCTQTVTVNDTEAPAISCPTDMTVITPTGSCSATVNVGVPTATDNCDGNVTPVPSRSDNKPITDPFPVGTTTITWTATDSSGNHSSCNQAVLVVDDEDPTITCPANITTSTAPDQCSANVNPGTATASDNCGPTTVSGSRSDGQPLNAPYPKGTTTITWTATDASGNSSSCTQTVTVNDTQNPTISCPEDIEVYLPPNTPDTSMPVTYETPAGSDNCPGATTTQTAGLPSGASFPVGTTTNTFRVTDAAGNFTECSFTVTVLYNFTGFFSPVGNPPILNSVNAGRAIPVKFSLSGNKGLNIFAPDSPYTVSFNCDTNDPGVDVVETNSANGSSLSYSPDTYTYNWKTESSWAGTCRRLVVTLNDGSEHTANFKFR